MYSNSNNSRNSILSAQVRLFKLTVTICQQSYIIFSLHPGGPVTKQSDTTTTPKVLPAFSLDTMDIQSPVKKQQEQSVVAPSHPFSLLNSDVPPYYHLVKIQINEMRQR